MISAISGSGNLAQSYMTQMRQQMFNKIDTDGDGKHSKDEISAMVANGPQGGPSVDEIFSMADTDEDGYITQSEFDANSPPNREMQGSGLAGMTNVSSADFLQQMFNKIDTDGDGALSTDEINQMVANGPQGGPSVDEIFSKADSDGDGYISQSEFDANSPPNREMQGSGFAGMTNVSSADFLQQMFNKIDTDGDGKHSKDEISAMVANGPQGGPSVDEIFSKADSDGDGYISQSEFDAVQGNDTVQSSNSVDSLVKTLLEILDEEKQTTSSATNDASQQNDSVTSISQMINDALKNYIQLSTNGFSQGNVAQSLLGSTLYV